MPPPTTAPPRVLVDRRQDRRLGRVQHRRVVDRVDDDRHQRRCAAQSPTAHVVVYGGTQRIVAIEIGGWRVGQAVERGVERRQCAGDGQVPGTVSADVDGKPGQRGERERAVHHAQRQRLIAAGVGIGDTDEVAVDAVEDERSVLVYDFGVVHVAERHREGITANCKCGLCGEAAQAVTQQHADIVAVVICGDDVEVAVAVHIAQRNRAGREAKSMRARAGKAA